MTIKKLFIKTIVFSVILVMMIAPMLTCYAEDADTQIVNGGLEPDICERLSTELFDQQYGLPSSYDPRQSGFLTSVKDQGDSNLCWMYANVGVVEALVSKKYGSKLDLSEAHGAVAMSNSMGSASVGYYPTNADNSGVLAKSLQYLTNWNTPIFNNPTPQWLSTVEDSDYPLSKVVLNNVTSIDDDFTNAESLVNVTSAHYVKINDKYTVKRAILEYGAVATGVFSLRRFWY